MPNFAFTAAAPGIVQAQASTPSNTPPATVAGPSQTPTNAAPVAIRP